MQRNKGSTSPSIFSSYLKIIIHVHETWFSKHTFKRTRWFLRYVNFLINYRHPKLENCYLNTEENLVTIFLEQKVNEKLNTRFDYYIWESCLLYFVVLNVCCVKLFVALNPYYWQILEHFDIKLCSLHFYFKLTTKDFTPEN